MKRAKWWVCVVPLIVGTGAWAGKVQLPTIPGLEDASLNINAQLQAWIQSTENSPVSGGGSPQRGINTQVFMRRIRLITSGDITKQFHFFIQLDSPNFGRPTGTDPTGLTGGTGVTNGRILLQDAQLIYEPIPGVFIEMGLLLLPLSHTQVQSTTSFVTLDLHANTIRFPGFNAGVNTTATAVGGANTATTGLREPGIQVRGWILDKRLGFRLGVFNGVRGTQGQLGTGINPGGYNPVDPTSTAGVNPSGAPQLGAYLHYNFLDTEERGWLYQGVYFNNKPILGVGVGAGWQAKAIRGCNQLCPGTTVPLGPQDWRAFAADVYTAWPLFPDHELIAQVAFYNYDFGTNNANTGNGGFAELGYRFEQFQPFVAYEAFWGSENNKGADARIWWAGINWWYRRINSLKFEFEITRTGYLTNNNTVVRSGTIQWQLFF